MTGSREQAETMDTRGAMALAAVGVMTMMTVGCGQDEAEGDSPGGNITHPTAADESWRGTITSHKRASWTVDIGSSAYNPEEVILTCSQEGDGRYAAYLQTPDGWSALLDSRAPGSVLLTGPNGSEYVAYGRQDPTRPDYTEPDYATATAVPPYVPDLEWSGPQFSMGNHDRYTVPEDQSPDDDLQFLVREASCLKAAS